MIISYDSSGRPIRKYIREYKGYDSSGRPIRKYKGYYIWKVENRFYEVRKDSVPPTVLGEIVCWGTTLRNVKRQIDEIGERQKVKMFKWQIVITDKVDNMSNKELLNQTLWLAGGDDYEGEFTTKGRFEYNYLTEELNKRLPDNWLEK